jgi:group I intron endonuclease
MKYLYKITNLLNNKVYIGQSYSETERWRQHKYCARSKPKQYIDRTMKKYGISNFIYEVIAIALSQEDTDFTEIELIKQFNSQDRNFGYNISPGGDKIWNEGLPKEKHPMFGRHHSEESKKKISEANSGKLVGPCTEERKRKISEANKGKTFSSIHKKKLSDAKLGKSREKMSEEVRQKIAKANTGKTQSEELRKKQSEQRMGFLVSDEVKRKISLALKGENGPNSKLSNIQCLEIIEKKKNGISAVNLAIEYKVSKKTIHNIVKKGINYYESRN